MSKGSIVWTWVNYSVISTVTVSIFVLMLSMQQSEQHMYPFLIERKIATIPFGLFVIGVSAIFGGAMGYAIGQYMKRRLDTVSSTLLQIENGRYDFPFVEEEDEFTEITRKVSMLGKKFEEQALSFQQLITDRTEWSEEMRQATISQERNRLARELHDSVSQQLFAMSMMVSAVREEMPDQDTLSLIEKMVIHAQSEMRALLLHLRPVQLEGKKLTEGIEELLTELSSKQQLKIDWYIESIELAKGIEDHLFRILQEALSNTLRHAKAQQMEVRLRKIDTYAILKILDDGIGFDVALRKAGSYGLSSMQERTQEIGGTCKIISVPHKGTQIEIKVPIIHDMRGERG